MRVRAAAVALAASLVVAAALIWSRSHSPIAPDGTASDPARQPTPHFAEIPKIDVHVHVPPSLAPSATRLLRRHGVVVALNASGGHPGRRLERSRTAGGEALRPYCYIDWREIGGPDFAAYAREALSQCKAQGAVGLKIFKSLGLRLILPSGDLLAVDDARLDVAFEQAGELGLPVLIHSGDPRAFFEAPTPDNERYAELQAHPGWSFYGPREDGGEWPSWRDLLKQFENRVARHPQTTFIGAHFGNAPEDPHFVGQMLDRYPNYYVETGARIPEIGRHAADEMRAFFVRYQDRILFGTDFQALAGGFVLGSSGADVDGLAEVPRFFESHWTYFETDDTDFAHPTPIQGEWTIDGIDLPNDVLHKIYHQNAERLFGIQLEHQSEP